MLTDPGQKTTTRGSVFIETYGCQMNRVDSEIVTTLLEEHGYERANSIDDAGIILINTCAVREHAQEKAISNIAHFRAFKERNKDIRIGVIGCLSKHLGDELAERLPFLDWVMGPDAYRALPGLLQQERTKLPKIVLDGKGLELYDEILPARREGINAWVTISRGCNNHCTYCVVPGARGEERNRPAISILREIEKAVSDGFPQVTLLGQNVNSYQHNSDMFADLLEKVGKIEGLKRIRFMTSHPKDCSDNLLEILGSGLPFCPELHLPVQAGSNHTLKRMGRGYTREHYLSLVEKARSTVPGLLLSTDIIVGFPGESEKEFEETADLVRKVGYDDAYIYRYSERPGTPAANMNDDVANEDKVRRLMILNDLVRESGAFNRTLMIGKTYPVIIEGLSAKSDQESMGRTPAGHVVVIPEKMEPGEEVQVKMVKLSGFTLRGRVV
ncbi:tRNA (N6-isopentenyl adenosine(37)-C2)-methylthiotransferase MiaB [bacterium]|nr:tRNA (N6-isopentenyl adenosine(37)-C2)-methylthiotransferase MiaB [bacterium]